MVERAGDTVPGEIGVSKPGRITGHGLGVFFILMGVGFVVAAMSGVSDWLDENSTCTYGGSCPDSSRNAFLIIGASFVGAGLFTSLLTELVIRKTQGMMSRISTFATTAPTSETVADFLDDFGIKIDPGHDSNVNVQHQAIDLRGQRTGEVPTDPAGLNNYLKSFGINISDALLGNATVVEGGRAVQQGTPAAGQPVTAPLTGSPTATESKRERATIVRKHDRGETAGNQRLLELELEVTPVGGVPYRVTVASLVRESLAGLLIEGSTLNVRVDSRDSNAVTIDWSEN